MVGTSSMFPAVAYQGQLLSNKGPDFIPPIRCISRLRPLSAILFYLAQVSERQFMPK